MRILIGLGAALALISALAAPALASAEDEDAKGNWVEVNFDDTKKSHDLIDTDSIKRDGDLVRVRLRTVFDGGFDGLNSGNALLEINCKSHKIRLLTLSVVTTEGTRQASDDPTDWSPISETSPAFYAEKAACKK